MQKETTMACQFCERDSFLKFGSDCDFCCASHRKTFYQHLRKALREFTDPAPIRPAGPATVVLPIRGMAASGPIARGNEPILRKPDFSGIIWNQSLQMSLSASGPADAEVLARTA